MKLRNKKTGVIATLTMSNNDESLLLMVDGETLAYNVKLSELKEWEDYEEPKTAWFIDPQGDIQEWRDAECDDWTLEKSIGNYFETKEEAERAVEKLKAWKRLKDTCNFRFTHWVIDKEKAGGKICFRADNKMITFDEAKGFYNDFYLLFGGEE